MALLRRMRCYMLGFDWDGNGVDDSLDDVITIELLDEDEEEEAEGDEEGDDF